MILGSWILVRRRDPIPRPGVRPEVVAFGESDGVVGRFIARPGNGRDRSEGCSHSWILSRERSGRSGGSGLGILGNHEPLDDDPVPIVTTEFKDLDHFVGPGHEQLGIPIEVSGILSREAQIVESIPERQELLPTEMPGDTRPIPNTERRSDVGPKGSIRENHRARGSDFDRPGGGITLDAMPQGRSDQDRRSDDSVIRGHGSILWSGPTTGHQHPEQGRQGGSSKMRRGSGHGTKTTSRALGRTLR